jgi:dihydropyrimidinase
MNIIHQSVLSRNKVLVLGEGMTVTGVPAVTISQGKVVYEDGELKTVRGAGRYIKRPCFPSYWENQMLRNELAEPTKVDRG